MQPDATVPPPTDDERKLTLIMYILAIFSGWLAPLIIFLVKRDSKFVGFHALQTLFFHIGYVLLAAIGIIFWFFAMIGFAATSAAKAPGPPLFIFLLFPIIWGGWILLWLANLIVCITFGIKANNGEWPAIPVLGGWARRIVKV